MKNMDLCTRTASLPALVHPPALCRATARVSRFHCRRSDGAQQTSADPCDDKRRNRRFQAARPIGVRKSGDRCDRGYDERRNAEKRCESPSRLGRFSERICLSAYR